MLSYIYSWIYPVPAIPEAPTLQPIQPIQPIQRIQPVRSTQRPIQLMQQTKLEDILSVKLRKVDVKSKTTCYEPRHPVLRELMKATTGQTTTGRDAPPAV